MTNFMYTKVNMESHLLEARRAAGISRPEMHVVYVLRLKPDEQGVAKWYVGHTRCLMERLHNHIMGNERSASWVRRWGYDKLVETRYCEGHVSGITTEVGLTVEYKAMYGWDNVRGGQDINTNSSISAQPSYWEPPADGLVAHRARSNSPGESSNVETP